MQSFFFAAGIGVVEVFLTKYLVYSVSARKKLSILIAVLSKIAIYAVTIFSLMQNHIRLFLNCVYGFVCGAALMTAVLFSVGAFLKRK